MIAGAAKILQHYWEEALIDALNQAWPSCWNRLCCLFHGGNILNVYVACGKTLCYKLHEKYMEAAKVTATAWKPSEAMKIQDHFAFCNWIKQWNGKGLKLLVYVWLHLSDWKIIRFMKIIFSMTGMPGPHPLLSEHIRFTRSLLSCSGYSTKPCGALWLYNNAVIPHASDPGEHLKCLYATFALRKIGH